MSVSADQLKMSIPIEIGDMVNTDWPSGVVATNLDLIWNTHADKAATHLYLQYLYAKRTAINYLQGAVWQEVNRKELDFSASFSDQYTHLETMKAEIRLEIAVFEEASADSYVTIEIAQTAPVMPGQITSYVWLLRDANAPRLFGSPYQRSLIDGGP